MTDLRRPPDHRTVAATAVMAVAVDVAVRAGPSSIGGVAATTAAAAGVVVATRATNPQAVGAALLAVGMACFAALRSSAWLIPFDLLAAAGALVLAASYAGGGSLFDLHLGGLADRTRVALAQLVHGPRYVLPALPRRGPGSAVLRGAAIAAPLVGVLGYLLASADAVFASLFRLPVRAETLPGHVVLLAAGAWMAAALLRLAVVAPPASRPPLRRRLGEVEASVVLLALVALYGAFASVQLVTLLDGADHLLSQAGLTRADYARSGFFQLLAASGLTLLVLLGGRALVAGRDGRLPRRPLALALATIGLTLLIVAVAIGRLRLYEEEYGLTMLRLSSTAFALWLAVVFVLLGLCMAGVAGHRHWLLPAAGATALAVLIGFNLANPEAFVVRRNLALAEGPTQRFDPVYLTGLSDDAVPTLVEALPRLDPDRRRQVETLLCRRPVPGGGFWSFNASRRGAADALASVCPGR